MKYKEFLNYLEKNLSGYKIFILKALQFQHAKNAKRPAKSRWQIKKWRRQLRDVEEGNGDIVL